MRATAPKEVGSGGYGKGNERVDPDVVGGGRGKRVRADGGDLCGGEMREEERIRKKEYSNGVTGSPSDKAVFFYFLNPVYIPLQTGSRCGLSCTTNTKNVHGDYGG